MTREARTIGFELADDTGEVAVAPNGMTWMCVAPRPEQEPGAAEYRAERGLTGAFWVIHGRVAVGAEILAIGELESARVADARDGYRGGAVERPRLVAGDRAEHAGVTCRRCLERDASRSGGSW